MPEYTRKEFVDKLRASLPDRYRILSDDKLLEATYQSGYKPEFKPEPQPDPGFIDGLVQPAKEQFYRIPETAASVYNSITEQMYPNDPEMQSIRKDLYEAASQYSNELVQSDDRLQTFQKWASENPFEWGKFFTNPTMFSSTFSSVATSMGAIIGAGALGEVLAGPAGAIGAGLATAYALESSEAYRQTYDRAKAKGYSDEEIDKLSADSAFMYGIGSSILETLVPLSILKSFGISKRIAKQSFGKFASKYIDDVVAGNGGDAIASGARAWQQYALESISMAQRLKTYAPILGESLTEASTEGAQYLLEEGIVDNMVDGSEITLDWISSKLSTPEFSQSIAGGLLGGGVFSGGVRLTGDAIYGTNGTQIANAMHALGKKKELPDEVRQKMYDSHVQRDDISHVDKVDFAKRLIELEGNDAVDQAVSEANKVTTPSEPVEPKVAEQKAKPEPKVDTTPKTEPIKPTQKPQEPPRSTQKEKPAPSIPKQSKPAESLIEPNSIPSKLVNPDRGRVTEIPGADTKEKAYNWMVVEGSDSVKKQLSKLSPNDKQTVLGLAASALIETAEKPATPEKARQYFYNKDGTVNEARLMDAIDALGEKGVFIETKTVSEGLGQPTQVRSRVIKPKEYMFDIIKSIEESGAISEIESGIADEILKPAIDEAAATQADDIIKGQVSEVQAPVDLPKQERTTVTKDKQAARVINENKLKTKRIVKPADYLVGKKPNEAQDQLLRKIMPLLKNLDVIEFEGDLIAKSKVGKGGRSNGMYPDGAKSILISKDAPDPVRTFIHESVHYLTANAVNNPKNDKDRAFKKRIGEIRKIATTAIVNKSSSFKYLSQNDAEFIAGALAEPDFQKELARIDSDKKGESLWSDFINAVKRLLGITRSNTLLDEAINEVIGYVEKQVKPEIKAESRKKSPPNPKPKKNVDTGEFTGKEIDIKGHDITEKDDLEGFSQLADEDLSYSTNSESDLYQLEDDRDGIQDEEATSETESNPREFFFTSFGVYLTEPQYGKIADYAKKFSNLKVSNRQELDKFYDMLDSNLKSMIKEMTGNDPIIENQDKHSKEIREWFQKTVSRQPVMFDAVSGKGRNKLQMLLRVVDGSVIGKALQPLMRVKLDTARRDDAGNLVGGKKHGKTDAISFIEYDQYKYGAKTKLFYLNVNDIYTEEIARTFTGKIFSKFRKASPFEWSLTGEQVRNMNDDFANAFLSGKDKFLKVFFAERSGDNSKVMIAAVPDTSPFAKYTRDDLDVMLRADLANEFLSEDHIQQFLDSGDALAESNPLIYAQLAILHDKWKNIKGFNYLTRFKDVASAYKRLKIDTTEGTMIRGIGDSTIYIIDPNEVDMARVIDGVEVSVKHLKPDGSSAFDGAIWSSARRIRKINHALGSNSYVFKTFIRFLEMDKTKPGYGIDYIGVKMAEFHPEPGMRVKQKGTNKILASYDGNIWKDRSGNEFEILATPDEVKDRSGIYSQNYTVLNLPEHATILKMSYDKSKTDGAHPVAAHELSLDPDYIESNDFAKKYLQSVFNHYRSLIKDTVDYLYSLRPDPIFTDMTNEEIQATRSANIAKAKAIRNIVQKELKPGQKLMEMDIVADIFENGEGFYMPNFMKQLIHSLSNKFIVNGLFKARQMKKGNATKLLIKPNVGYNIPEDGVIISSQNKTFYSNVKKAYLESSNISLDGMSRDEEVAQINNWLKDNPYYVLVHRQPIQSFTKVVPRKISEFSTGLQGETIIMNLEDVFYLHDGDHDGDSVFVERFDNDLVDTMLEQARQDKFRARNRTVDLGIFEKGDLGKSLADINSVYKLIADRQSAAGAQGMAVNIKTALARFAYKGFKLEFSNGQKMEAYNPTDKSIMWYLPLSQEYLDSKVVFNGQEVTVLDRIKGEGDDVTVIGSKKYLVTTKENEFSILLQAAVDNDKFNLLSKIPLEDKFGASISLHSFMLSRIFKMSEGEVANKNNFTRDQLKTLKVFFDIFNVSTLRSGNDSDRSKLDMNGVINESEIYTSLYYVSGSNEIKPAADISNALLQKFRSDTYRRKGFASIKNVSVNNKLTPSDMLVMAPAIRHRQLSETLSQYQEGLALNGPLLATDPMYKLAHFETMNQISEWIQEQYNSDKSDIREIISGIKFADKVGTAFYDSFSKAEAGTKSVMSKNDDAFNVKYDYDEGIQNNVIEPYQQEFNELSDIAKRWSSIRFMDGINYHDTKLSTTIKLLPMQLMDKGVVKEYGTRYMHNIYNSAGSGTMRGAEARSRDLAKIFADIRTQSRELGENHSIGKLESKKDNYCG